MRERIFWYLLWIASSLLGIVAVHDDNLPMPTQILAIVTLTVTSVVSFALATRRRVAS